MRRREQSNRRERFKLVPRPKFIALITASLVVLPIVGYAYATRFPNHNSITASREQIVIDLTLRGPARSFAKLKEILNQDAALYEPAHETQTIVNYRRADFRWYSVSVGVLKEGDVADKVIEITVRAGGWHSNVSIEGIRIGQSLDEARAIAARQGFQEIKDPYAGADEMWFDAPGWSLQMKLDRDRKIAELFMIEPGYTTKPLPIQPR